ncbi:Acetyl-coenzyme A synthetase [Pseudovibrio axinellae]|uniref:Acetyl-coenzyme A synthetase n=1 Tax=Pseudovibrio axinellae TaxID=989403 RepID=A0A165X372_9HYPH|nr:AMP-binding protein [Pseudovibrio axinellae]KZL17303.1 Acetyl-coenzyme A synthetase [Pseudovibrio axinellae]SEQ19470.1 acetyl-CoA synthetase [Pseudovibrio axinellae]
MLSPLKSYEELRSEFRWDMPERYNIAYDACDRWANVEPERLALLHVLPSGSVEEWRYGQLKRSSSQLANALYALGVVPRDRVALLLPQAPETAISHLAIYRLGGIAVPLAALFGPEALRYRLENAEANVVVTNRSGLEKLSALREQLPFLEHIVCVDGDGQAHGDLDFWSLLQKGADRFEIRDTSPDDPALMIYTSGTTGQPKGALLAHRVLLGHLPGVQMAHELLPQPGDLFWTPADWAWAGGLLNALLPSLKFGVPVVTARIDKFDPEGAFDLMVRHGVRNAFIPPTALKMMRSVDPSPYTEKLKLRSVCSAGEALGAEAFSWSEEALGVTPNEMYGQTECNLVLGSGKAVGVSKAGAIGRPVPGHEVSVIRPDGSVCDASEQGEIAVRRGTPVMFLQYWQRPDADESKFLGDWMLTGDQGVADAEGYIHFVGRNDDVITSAGYRIGPSEIEDYLITHEAVGLAAVVGKPDPVRTEIVKAYIVLKDGYEPSEALTNDIRQYVRVSLSAHEYPREIDFVSELPLTTSGKVIRRILRDRARKEVELVES